MDHSTLCKPLLISALAGLLALPTAAWAQDDDEFTTDFFIESCTFASTDPQPFGGNPLWSLEVGHQLRLEGEDDEEEVEVLITVLDQTELITFTTMTGQVMTVETRVVEERELVDGELDEVSRNWFARCRETNDIFYFGEEVDLFEDGEIVGTEGEWRAGEDGAHPGIVMPGTFLLGARYFQEIAPGVALDRAEHVEMDLEIDTEVGSFHRCVEVFETTPLEPDDESVKRYCPGVGLVFDDGVELVEATDPAPPAAPAGAWLMAPGSNDFRFKVRITSDGEVQPTQQEMGDCDPETVCVSGALAGRIEVLARVIGPRPNGCFWPQITKLTPAQAEVWIEQISSAEVRYYLMVGSSPGSYQLEGFFDRTGFCP
ncbi:MAG TPA: hypothetical protein VMT16_03195 [Thermoanaerobaculia bacterium]|nr:hypothetical protein [Thermoanaerobaculia bacterium]